MATNATIDDLEIGDKVTFEISSFGAATEYSGEVTGWTTPSNVHEHEETAVVIETDGPEGEMTFQADGGIEALEIVEE